MIGIDFHDHTGKRAKVYGQTEGTNDQSAAQDGQGTTILHGLADVMMIAC